MKRITIGIAGGSGGMGRWFEAFFTRLGHTVHIAGRRTAWTYRDLVQNCEVVALSTPLAAALDIVAEIGPQMQAGQLLLDFCSQKEKIVAAMADQTTAEIIGTHPMFAPYTPTINGQNVILCPAEGRQPGSGTWWSWLENLLRSEGAVVTCLGAAEHDRKMAVSQSLMHFLTICLAQVLKQENIRAEEAFLFSTPIFRLNVDLIGRLLSQDLTLYADLVSQNPHAPETVEKFAAALSECREIFFKRDYHSLLEYLQQMQDFFGPDFCQQALTETNRALDGLYQAVLGNTATSSEQS